MKEYPKEQIAKMVDFLKNEKKMSIKKIEEELKFSNGLLGKAISGKTTLSEEKIGKLGSLYFKHMTDGKPVGYLKILSTGEVEVGVIEPETPQISTQSETKAEQGKEKKVENSQPNEQIQPRNFHEYLIAAKIGIENVNLFKEWVSGDKKLTAGQKSMIISKL